MTGAEWLNLVAGFGAGVLVALVMVGSWTAGTARGLMRQTKILAKCYDQTEEMLREMAKLLDTIEATAEKNATTAQAVERITVDLSKVSKAFAKWVKGQK